MNARSWLVLLIWPVVLLGAGVFFGWTTWARVRHVQGVTRTGEGPVKPDASSPTGYPGRTRELIVPGYNFESFNWIAQTQQMFSRREWRVRSIDYENAPVGRELSAPSPYRWWLGALGWLDHRLSGRPLGLAVERMALLADPFALLVLLIATSGFVAWRFGPFPAALVAVGLVAFFPWGGAFQPGAPDDRGLAQACGLWSVLLLLAGVHRAAPTVPSKAGPSVACWFCAAGIMGGVGLWLSVATETPILAGIGLGALAALGGRFPGRRGKTAPDPLVLPWRVWALGLAATSGAAYLAEFFPGHLGDWRLRAVHPVFGVFWLGVAEVITQADVLLRRGKAGGGRRPWILAGAGIVALASLPVALWRMPDTGFLTADFLTHRLSNLPDAVNAVSLAAWLIRDGFNLKVWATILPATLALPAAWLLFRAGTDFRARVTIALALGPFLVALGLACRQLSWWSGLDALGLTLLIAIVAAADSGREAGRLRWLWAGWVAVLAGLGAAQLIPSATGDLVNAFSPTDVEELIDRDLAHWLGKHAGADGAIVLAPPKQTSGLHFFGGLRGLGTLDLENRDGIGAAVRIVSATTPEEAQELIRRREVNYLVIPSWDTSLDEYAVLGLGQVEGSFLDRLHRWDFPTWLRPVAYQLPKITGFENQSVLVLEVVDSQSDPVAMSRLAEYFVEMGQLDRAAAAAQALKRFPVDLGAQVARLDVELAVGVTPEFSPALDALVGRLARKADRTMPWDRRVSLAVLLARTHKAELAQEQMRRCLAEVDAAKLRALTPGSLYRLEVLAKAFGLTIADPGLHDLALDLLPEDLRSRF